ncbi:MAG: site-2 protease family protein, partial [Victivallales bacterium]|nr:site-2 protease family protein [Victivallales bacterium]
MEIFSTILKIIFIVFFFGFCVFIHELGHLLAALWQGLHVEKFSIGMGPKIWGFKYRGVEYVVSWLPFGGYVSLPQLDPTDTPKTSDDRELPHVPARARAITAFAGPFFNVLFGFVLATAMWAAGLWMPAKSSAVIVDTVPTFLPHVVEGIEPDDIILSIEGRKAPENSNTRWDDLAYIWGEIFAEKHPHPEKISLRIRQASTGEVKDVEVVPAYNPEWEAGLRRGDRITSVNGRKFETGVDDFRQEYVYNKSSRLQMTVVTGEETREVSYTPAPNPRMENLGYPFFHFSNPAKVGDVVQESIAWNAGMRAGDQLFALNGTNINSIYLLGKNLQKLQGQEVIFTVGRGRETMKLAPMALPAQENLSFSTIVISFKVLAAEVVPGS